MKVNSNKDSSSPKSDAASAKAADGLNYIEVDVNASGAKKQTAVYTQVTKNKATEFDQYGNFLRTTNLYFGRSYSDYSRFPLASRRPCYHTGLLNASLIGSNSR